MEEKIIHKILQMRAKYKILPYYFDPIYCLFPKGYFHKYFGNKKTNKNK